MKSLDEIQLDASRDRERRRLTVPRWYEIWLCYAIAWRPFGIVGDIRAPSTPSNGSILFHLPSHYASVGTSCSSSAD